MQYIYRTAAQRISSRVLHATVVFVWWRRSEWAPAEAGNAADIVMTGP
jgi:hypothetical protein